MTSIHWAQFMCGCCYEGVDFTLKAEKTSKNRLFLLHNISQLSCNLSIWTNFSLGWIADHNDDVIQRQTPELLHRQWIIEQLLQLWQLTWWFYWCMRTYSDAQLEALHSHKTHSRSSQSGSIFQSQWAISKKWLLMTSPGWAFNALTASIGKHLLVCRHLICSTQSKPK